MIKLFILSVCLYTMCVQEPAEIKKRVFDPLVLELKEVVSCLMNILGRKLNSSTRVLSAAEQSLHPQGSSFKTII